MTGHTETAVQAQRPIAFWMFGLCLFIALVLLAGGMTRLTDSGLSITEWKPVSGVIPPLSDEAWQQEFTRYQQIPEYRLLKPDMTLDGFKTIFWWEWTHRFLARVSGLVFLVPFAWFLAQGKLRRREMPKFLLLLALGGAQGVLGWYMVQSGLSVRVDVSQYRLAAHLGLALLVYGYALWIGLGYWRGPRGSDALPNRIRMMGMALCALIYLQMLMGALVAGLDAGLTYNSWPLMDGYWVPPGLFRLTPWPLNLFENVTLVQFDHRFLGVLVLALTVAFRWAGRGYERLSGPLNAVLMIVCAQFALGVWTLLAVAPIAQSAAHQLGALICFSAALWLAHIIWRPQGAD
ncbi:MAG: heme A synthase [Alphaproteobacteria bacterium]|nr:heme A synthase [Alphaproteobacteria bacterium]